MLNYQRVTKIIKTHVIHIINHLVTFISPNRFIGVPKIIDTNETSGHMAISFFICNGWNYCRT